MHRPLVWVDIAFAVAIAGFVALVLFFRSADAFVPLMGSYMLALVGLAFVAEWAAIRVEASTPHPIERAPRPSGRADTLPTT